MEAHPIVEVLVADVVATVVIFLCSALCRNSSFYDAYWSVAPPVIALWFAWLAVDAPTLRQAFVLIVVFAWAIRLTGNWAYGWQGMRHEDWRYEDLADTAGVLWWPLSLFGIHLFPTILVFLGCLALYPALTVGTAPVGFLDYLALALGLGATALEFQADRELHQFRAHRTSKSEVLDSGVWAWCRHPNYLGEIGFWVSLFLFGCSAWEGVYPWSWLGPVAMIALFLGVSIPMIEKKLSADKPGYPAYQARTKQLIPGVF